MTKTVIVMTTFLLFHSCSSEKIYYEDDDARVFNTSGTLDLSTWNQAHQNLQTVYNSVVVDKKSYTQVNYGLINTDQNLTTAFEGYLTWLENLPSIVPVLGASQSQATKDLKKAFWTNVYNACVIDIVRKNLNVISSGGTINDIKLDFSAGSNTGVFDTAACRIAGSALSLNEIETGILRNAQTRNLIRSTDSAALPIDLQLNHDFSDANSSEYDRRIHYGVNCASSSCPMLSPTVFSSSNIENSFKQLESTFWQNGVEAGEPHRRQIRQTDSGVSVNPVFAIWYKDDFEDLSSYIQGFLADDDPIKSALSSGAAIRYTTETGQIDYDWRSNITDERGQGTLNYQETFPEDLLP